MAQSGLGLWRGKEGHRAFSLAGKSGQSQVRCGEDVGREGKLEEVSGKTPLPSLFPRARAQPSHKYLTLHTL